MTDITQNNDTYPPAIYQIGVTDPVLGGAGGIANKAAAALADRTAYLRMRNVTPWVPGLDQPYPAHAYVQRSGLTYKSLVANANIDPATPAAVGIWERWAYTESEMYAFLKNNHGGNCPATGPAAAPSAAAPWTMYTSVAPYLEVWMWVPVLGWKVIANRYGSVIANFTTFTLTAGVYVTIPNCSFTMPRAGKIAVSNYCHILSAGNVLNLNLQTNLNGSSFMNEEKKGPFPSGAGASATNSYQYLSVSAGDVLSVSVRSANDISTFLDALLDYSYVT